MKALPEALSGLRSYKQFIVYKLVPSTKRPGKTDKFPCDFRSGLVVSAHDSQYWTDCDTAIASAVNFGDSYGVGFVFTDGDPFFFLDIDNQLRDGVWSPESIEMCSMVAGVAIEVSQSGEGMHAIGIGRPPENRSIESPLKVGGLYYSRRFVALTGINIIGNVNHTVDLNNLAAKYFPPSPGLQSHDIEWTSAPREDWRGPESDEDLIRRAMRSRGADSAFGGKASFADLWNCNIEALARTYPDVGRAYNESDADLALAQHLAFWTGNNCERIERLMVKSKLAREKWGREDYIELTILKAVSRQFDVLTDKTFELPVEVVTEANEPPKPTLVQGSTFATNADQIALFAGCVYVNDAHRVLVPGGNLLKPEQFKVAYGGYTFTMDAANEKTTRDAWEAFTQNQAFRCPRVDTTCFKPSMPPGSILGRDGVKSVNTYWPVEVDRKVGDATIFLTHLEKMIPNDRDRLILICYMAACVQYQGHKFQWAPLIQGAPGNGKSLLSRCVAEAIGRRYVHWPKASKLAAQFNGWMVGRTFYAVEDIHVPGAKMEIIEELKPMITGGDGLEIEKKGVDQVSADICGNFIFNCNSKSDLPKTNDDRRYAVFHSAQQTSADIVRDGMGGDYFPKIYSWLREEGYAIINDLLWTYPIPSEFNPAVTAGGLLHRAPDTSSTKEAIDASMGGIEQEILEAIAQGLPGFCGGWISSIMLDRLLEKLGVARRVTHYKRKEMLSAMGYEYHPALHDGRVNNVVLPDQSKPRLFIKKDAAARYIATAAEVGRTYENANNSIGFKV